jgi:hypothetical protein
MLTEQAGKERKWCDAIALGRLLGFPKPTPEGWTSVSYTSIERLADLLDIAKASSAGLPGSLSTIVDPHMLRETMRDLDRLRCELRSHLADIDRRAHDIEELMEVVYARLQELSRRPPTTLAPPAYQHSWPAEELNSRFPPRFVHPHKRAILRAKCPSGAQQAGVVSVSRWIGVPPCAANVAKEPCTTFVTRAGGFMYEPTGQDSVDWWVNFAAGDLFEFYADRCFAQDEVQVFEHPVLASVREAMLATGASTRVTDRGHPTPILIRGAERRIRFHTEPRPDLGRAHWLYGRNFSNAPLAEVMDAAEVLDPPQRSNILVIEAPAYGRDEYRATELRMAIVAAFSGFLAARRETEATQPGSACVIHTGFWGCGAYGGNHVLMTAIQLLAAEAAGVDTLVYYLWDEHGQERFRQGNELAAELRSQAPTYESEALIAAILSRKFRWGTGNGT